jgi:3-isopropylmalate/(R)-2-methylmalate dehydratase small subunit
VSLKLLGISAVLARSFARIFYRNAINLGLPVFVLSEALEIRPGDELAIDAVRGVVENLTTAARYAIAPMPAHLMQMIADGGLIAHLRHRLAHNDETPGDVA